MINPTEVGDAVNSRRLRRRVAGEHTTEKDIQDYWNRHPCGDGQVEGLQQRQGDYEAFFADYDRFRYKNEGHILNRLDDIDFKDKRVLEIGLGQGADSEQIIKRGGIWSGVDITPEAVDRVRMRLALRKLPHESVQQASVLDIPFENQSFDIVFSHGVLHHVPDIIGAQHEIRRVLRPGGELIVMLYSKWSLNYLLSIVVVRRLGLLTFHILNRAPGGIVGQHLEIARELGLRRYLRMKNFIHRSTDGPLNPYSKVYDLNIVEQDFPDFEIVRAYKDFMHAPPLPVKWLPISGLLGWHLWVHMKCRKEPRPTPAEVAASAAAEERLSVASVANT